jgi:YD repeat-containing protein
LVTSISDDAGGLVNWAYDGAGNRVEERRLVSPGVEQVRTWEFDGRGLPIRAVDPLGVETVTEYDVAGRVLRTTVDPGTGGLNLVTEFAYGDAGRTTQVAVDPDGLNIVSQTEYDAAGRVIATVVDPGGAGHLNRTTTYGFDNDGNLTTVTDALNRTTTTEVDALGRVVSVTDAASRVTSYEFDAAGRRTTAIDALGVRDGHCLQRGGPRHQRHRTGQSNDNVFL